MATKIHQKIIFYTNRAIESYFMEKTDAVERYLRMLEGVDGSSPLHLGYRQYVRALAAQDNERRIALLHDAHKSFLEAKALRGAAISVLNIGRFSETGRRALQHAIQAHDLFSKCNDQVGRSKALSNMGVNYMHLQNYTAACESLLEGIDIQQSTGDLVGMGVGMLNLAACYIYMGDNTRALYYSRESICCFEKDSAAITAGSADGGAFIWQTNGWKRLAMPSDGHLAHAYVNYGNALETLGEHDMAVETFIKAREMMRKLQDNSGEAMALNQIGEILREKEEPSRAEEYFRQSRDMFEQTGGHGYMYAVALQGVGESCAAQRKFSEALEHYQDALREFQSVENKAGTAEILLLMGELFIAQGDYHHALPPLKQGLAIGESIATTELVVRCNRALGSAMMHIDSRLAREYLSRALLLAEEYSMKLERRNIHRELSSYYTLIGESTDAFSHFQKFYALEKEIFTEQADQRIKNYEILHKVEQYKRSLSEMTDRIREIESELQEKNREMKTLAMKVMANQEFIELATKGLTRLIKTQPNRKDECARDLLQSFHSLRSIGNESVELAGKFSFVHHEFIERLLSIAPTLTQTEQDICILIRLSMVAKQIAQVMGCTPHNVYNHQQSIRTKLRLKNRQSLRNFLIMLDTAKETK